MDERGSSLVKVQSGDTAERLVKMLISLGFFMVSWIWSIVLRLGGRTGRSTCVALYYHRVPSEHRERFARQMDILLSAAKPVRADVRPPLPAGARYVLLTFDDGFQSAVENALPELKKRGIPAAIFVVTDALGQPPNWQNFGPVFDADDEVISVEQLRKLGSDSVIIGSHTMTHRMLTTLTEEEARREIVGSRAKLQQTLGTEVKLLSFPYGAFNQKVVELCREAGYDRTFTTSPALAFSDPEELTTGRVWAEPTDWPLEFRLKLLGAYRWLPIAFRLKRAILLNP